MRPSSNYARFMSEWCGHMATVSGMDHGAPDHTLRCSPYPGSGIDISVPGPTHLPENQGIQKTSHQPPLLHIPPLVFQNTPPQPSFNSPYRGGDLDITGESIFAWPEPQPITTSAVRTAVLHIASPIQHIGAHHRQRPALRVRDSSGKPGAPSSARGLAANSPTRLHLSRGTPKSRASELTQHG